MTCFTVLFLAASFMEVFSTNWKLWLGGKVLSQLALGMAISTIVTYLSEITPFQLRGTMMGAYQFFFGFGQFFGSIATQVLSITDPTKWRPALASEFIFTGFFMIFLIFLPESPYYYAKKKDDVNAKKMLKKLYGGIDGYDIVSRSHHL
jgi:SP family general alpha glucoside:H+ symporter-like MFS transporter